MNEKLVLTTVEIHKKRVDELNAIESDLIKLIAETGNEELMNKFLDWQNAKIRCNETFVATISKIANS
jgi:uncharacterized protein YrzB (UPF0473 family)